MLTRVTVAVRKAGLREELCRLLSRPDVLMETVKDGARGWRRVAEQTADVIIIELSLIPPPRPESVRLLGELPDRPTVVVISAGEDAEERARLLAAGCEAVLHEDLPPDALREVLGAVVERRAEEAGRVLLGPRDMETPHLADFVSESPAMQTFMEVTRRIVPSASSLLLLGETGVGKERLARAVHAESPRRGGPFVAINCGALPESLLESELFGHEKGAFTGAARTRRGLFELAHTGTVFLDEIGEMPYHLQVKLLRVLQDREVRPVGGERTIPVDVRIMAASNRDLDEEVEAGNFRRDLFYRLSVVTLTIPPLRERREDIPVLVESYLDYLQPRVGCDVDGITPEAVAALVDYSWPGNVRELINVIERALLLCDGRQVTLDDLPQGIRAARDNRAEAPAPDFEEGLAGGWTERPWKDVREEALAELERAYFAALLEKTGGRVGDAAGRAGISPRSLYEKMRRHELRKEDFRPPRD